MRLFLNSLKALPILLFFSCVYPPEDLKVVDNFEAERYLGTWYEIARFDYSFEKDLDKVSATYTLREDGGIDVLNKGYNTKKYKWEEAKGTAYFLGSPSEASLKVTFFWPFYAGYNVISIDPEYQYALVAGDSREYLWILSRTLTMPQEISDHFLKIAEDYGFNTSKLLWINQERN